jgi:hypothetical protein
MGRPRDDEAGDPCTQKLCTAVGVGDGGRGQAADVENQTSFSWLQMLCMWCVWNHSCLVHYKPESCTDGDGCPPWYRSESDIAEISNMLIESNINMEIQTYKCVQGPPRRLVSTDS